MKKTFSILVCCLLLATSVLASDLSINEKLDKSDINVFFSKDITNAVGRVHHSVSESVNGHLSIATLASDNSINFLKVIWKDNLGVEITQNDDYALKITANAIVMHNGIVKTNQKVYVHYSKITDTLVIRGYGFRFSIPTEE